jgi:regulator of protease activity HflC (stomatin/prohibitin superfamily)
MNKLFGLVCMLPLFTACLESVPAGHVGIIVDLYGSDKGVSEKTVNVGKYWVGYNEELYLFSTSTQNYVWTKSKDEGNEKDESISFQTKEGLSVNGDFGITYAINPLKVTNIFQKYRKGIDEITNVFLRNMVRDAFNNEAAKMGVEDVYGSGKKELMDAVNKTVKDQTAPIGIDIEKIYLIGDFRLPAPIIEAINAKIGATQKAMQIENELRASKAEAEKVVVKAEAEAKANKALQQSLSKDYLEYLAIQKWNGVLPTITSGSTPFVNLDMKAK